ncbi:hypothetical protein NUSPORA_02667 [Nucleospora cyclopteri]
MKNLFPKAQEVFIEETVGINRVNAHPPTSKDPKEGIKLENCSVKESIPLTAFPSWFKIDKPSSREKKIEIEARNFVVDFYREKKREIGVEETFLEFSKKCGIDSFDEFLDIFDFCEENKLINFLSELEETSGDLPIESTEINSLIRIVDTKYFIKKYVDPSLLEKAVCLNCSEKASFFTADLFFVCNKCFEQENYKSYQKKNFHALSQQLIDGIWSKKEEFLLLKGIEKHGDSWEEVAQFVGCKKSKEMCIFHFITLCILEAIEEYHVLPFTKFSNQITTFIAFISNSLDLSISAKIAKRFLAIMKSRETQSEVIDELLKISQEESMAVLEMSKVKVERLREVRLEALCKKISLKIQCIEKMYKEVGDVKEELIEKKNNIIQELSRLS